MPGRSLIKDGPVMPPRMLFAGLRSLLLSKRALRQSEKVLCLQRGPFFTMRIPFVDLKGFYIGLRVPFGVLRRPPKEKENEIFAFRCGCTRRRAAGREGVSSSVHAEKQNLLNEVGIL